MTIGWKELGSVLFLLSTGTREELMAVNFQEDPTLIIGSLLAYDCFRTCQFLVRGLLRFLSSNNNQSAFIFLFDFWKSFKMIPKTVLQHDPQISLFIKIITNKIAKMFFFLKVSLIILLQIIIFMKNI